MDLADEPTDVERLTSSFDHHDPDLNHEVLVQVYRNLADGDPVPSSDSHGGFRLITRHADVVEVEKNTSVFSSTSGVLHPPHEGRPPNIPIEFDGSEHLAYRKLFMDVLSAPRVRRIEPYLRDLTGRILEDYLASGSGDFVDGVASQLPIRAIGHLLGWGEAASAEMQSFADNILEHAGTPRMMDAIESLGVMVHREIDGRRENPTDDYLSRLIHLDFEGRRLRDDELLRIVQTFVFAGYETTAHAIASLVHHLATHPEQQHRVRVDADARANAIEEGLRLFPPVHTMFRTVVEPASMAGVDLEPGDRVVLMYGPANRDPERFECPHEFRVDRPEARQHLAFGIGPHFCAGAPLARAEMRVLLEALAELPPYELAGEVAYLPRLMMGQMMGVDHLPLRFVTSDAG